MRECQLVPSWRWPVDGLHKLWAFLARNMPRSRVKEVIRCSRLSGALALHSHASDDWEAVF